MRYHSIHNLLLLLLVIFLGTNLGAQNKNQNSENAQEVYIITKGLGSILCNEQYKVDYDDRKEFTLKNNADVRLIISPKRGCKLLKFTINGINRIHDIENNRIAIKGLSRKTIIVATFEDVGNIADSENVSNSHARNTQQKVVGPNLQQITVGFQQYTLKDFATKDIKSNYGVFASYGSTYLFNSTPSILNLGFDIKYVEVGYNNYQLKYKTETDSYHQVEIGIQAGLSLVLVTSGSFYGKLYIRYAPRYSMIHAHEKWYNSYGSYVVGGASLNFSNFGIGGEVCYGDCKYIKEEAPKNTNIGLRLFVSYNF